MGKIEGLVLKIALGVFAATNFVVCIITTNLRVLIPLNILVAIIFIAVFRFIASNISGLSRELGISLVRQRIRDKAQALEEILETERLRPEQVCYMGDDLVDLPVLRRVGFPVAVADAVPEVKFMAHLVTRNPGGRGAVREVCEKILKIQGKWEKGMRKFLSSPAG